MGDKKLPCDNQLVGSKADGRVAATNQAAERCAGDKRHYSGIQKANGAVKKKQWQQKSKLVEVDIALMRLWRGVQSRVGFESNTFFVLCFAASRGRPHQLEVQVSVELNRALMAAASWLGQSNGSVPTTSTLGI